MPRLGDLFKASRYFISHLARDPFQPGGQRFGYLKGLMTMNYRYASRHPRIPVRSVVELYPEAEEFIIPMEVRKAAWNITPTELYVISAIALAASPRRIFEFGTYDGATTLQLARLLPEAELTTIDFSPNPAPGVTVGARFAGQREAERICQLFGDTTTFNFSPYRGQFDFVFVDGGHEYPVVKADTQNALRMVRPGGVIVWDDYGNWPGVRRAIEELVPAYPVVQLADTKLAYLKVER